MKKILVLTLILTVASCGRKTGGSVAQGNIEVSPPPTQNSPVADSTFSIDSGDGGNYNVFTKDGLQYLTLRSNISESYFTRLNSTELDANFGTAGKLKLTGTGGVLGIVRDYYVYSQKCGDNVYSIAMAGSAYPTKLFKGVIGTSSISFTDITGDLNTRLGANAYQVGAFFCSKEHFVVITGRGNNAPTYAAYIAVNTTTDNVSLYLDTAGTQDEVMRSNKSLSYHYNGVDYLLQSKSGGMDRKIMTIDEGNRSIALSATSSVSTLYFKGDQRVRFFEREGQTWLMARDWGATNTVNILKTTMADIHTRISNNDFSSAPFISFDLPTSVGQFESETVCLTADGKTLGFTGTTTYLTNTTAYFYMDLTKTPPEVPLEFNNGQIFSFPVSSPYNSSVGVGHTAVSCIGGNIFFAYKKSGTKELIFDRYTP